MRLFITALLIWTCEVPVIACPDTFYEDTSTYSDEVEQAEPSDEVCEFPDECDEVLTQLILDDSIKGDDL